jgi:hypothetical protein
MEERNYALAGKCHEVGTWDADGNIGWKIKPYSEHLAI